MVVGLTTTCAISVYHQLEKGIDFQVIKYLDDTPSAEELKALLSQLKLDEVEETKVPRENN
jgi:arsenate reductase-like glutaredoxin family protein